MKKLKKVRKIMFREYLKETGIVLGILIVIVLGSIFFIENTQNGAISFEQKIETSKSNIGVEIKRKQKLFAEIVASVNSYKKYEGDTLKEIVKARQTNNSADITQAISVIKEAYPELKANEQYNKMMLEFSQTENRIANHQKAYNNNIESYNKYVLSFPNSFFLGLKGYQKQDYKRLAFEEYTEDFDVSTI